MMMTYWISSHTAHPHTCTGPSLPPSFPPPLHDCLEPMSTGTCMHYLRGLCVHVSVLCLHPFPSRECINMGTSASLLAQTFSLLVRQTADCLERCWDLLHSPTPPCVLPVREEDPGELYGWVWGELEGVWMWLVSAMDELESQLCLGNAVSRKIPKGTVIIRTNCSTVILCL